MGLLDYGWYEYVCPLSERLRIDYSYVEYSSLRDTASARLAPRAAGRARADRLAPRAAGRARADSRAAGPIHTPRAARRAHRAGAAESDQRTATPTADASVRERGGARTHGGTAPRRREGAGIIILRTPRVTQCVHCRAGVRTKERRLAGTHPPTRRSCSRRRRRDGWRYRS